MTPDEIVAILNEAAAMINESDPDFAMRFMQAIGAITALIGAPAEAPPAPEGESTESGEAITPQS